MHKFSSIARLVAVMAGLTLSLAGCTGLPVKGEPLGRAERRQLDSSLNVASASAEAGQRDAAARLYTQISRHYPSAPEPRLGLAYLALEAGDFTRAGQLFAEAAERSATPAARAESLLGAGRASLGTGDITDAKNHFLAASKVAGGTPAEAWVANGMGVVAAIEGDYAQARTHYDMAVRLSSSHPRITANLVRVLAQSGAASEARELYSRYPDSHWLDGDGAALKRLLGASGTGAATVPRARMELAASGPNVRMTASEPKAELKASETKAEPKASGAKVQLYAARSRARALAAWRRLAKAEEDLLGALTPRVVKADIAKRGVFYRLRAGPLPDTAAARRLCRLLKRRGLDCFVPAGEWAGGNTTGKPDRPGIAGGNSAARPGRIPATGRRRAVAEQPRPGAAGAPVQVYSARTHAGAMAAWRRLVAAEKDLLDSLTPRVVKADVPQRGVFYGLRAGPLKDRAAARRLCTLLKARGRDCFVPPGRFPANP